MPASKLDLAITDDPIPLGEHLGVAPSAGTTAAAPHGELLALSIEDLIPDSRGEIVIINDAGRDIAVITDLPVASEGVEASHVTATGIDVSGFAYCTFSSGITVFYPSTQRLLVTDEG